MFAPMTPLEEDTTTTREWLWALGIALAPVVVTEGASCFRAYVERRRKDDDGDDT